MVGFVLSLACSWATSTVAQTSIVTDGTLGPVVAFDGGDMDIAVELGETRGDNLFHSFSQFGIAPFDSATFRGGDALRNIIARVTGGGASIIDGTLGSEAANADLWLINPSGITFGPSSIVDIPASLHIATADEVRFADGGRFSAVALDASSLSVASPVSFGFLARPEGIIRLNGAFLALNAGAALTLSAAEIDLDTSFIAIEDGRITLRGADAPGAFAPSQSVDLADAQGEIRIAGSFVGTSGEGRGLLTLIGDSVAVTSDSDLFSDSLSEMDATGGVSIVARRLSVADSVQISADSLGEGAAGNVDILAEEIDIRRGGLISSDAFDEGHAGRVHIQADRMTIDAEEFASSVTGVTSTTMAGADGNAGRVEIDTDELVIARGGRVGISSFGGGDAGSVFIDSDRFVIDGARLPGQAIGAVTGVISNAEFGSTGNAGSVEVLSKDLQFFDGGQITNSTFGPGTGGTVRIVTDSLLADAKFFTGNLTGVTSSAVVAVSGNAGSIDIEAQSIELFRGGLISTSTFGTGNAGSINVNTDRLLADAEFFGGIITGIASGTFGQAVGSAGDVRIEAEEIVLRQSAQIGSSINSFAFSPDARAGSVDVRVGRLDLQSSSSIRSASFAEGAAGDIAADAGRIMAVDSAITTEGAGGAGGRIDIFAKKDVRLSNSQITTNGALPADNASLVTIEAPFIQLADFSRVQSLAGFDDISPVTGQRTGSANVKGVITIISDDSEIAASTSIVVQGIDADIGSDLRLPAVVPVDVDSLLTAACDPSGQQETSNFADAGPQLNPGPADLLGANARANNVSVDCGS